MFWCLQAVSEFNDELFGPITKKQKQLLLAFEMELVSRKGCRK